MNARRAREKHRHERQMAVLREWAQGPVPKRPISVAELDRKLQEFRELEKQRRELEALMAERRPVPEDAA